MIEPLHWRVDTFRPLPTPRAAEKGMKHTTPAVNRCGAPFVEPTNQATNLSNLIRGAPAISGPLCLWPAWERAWVAQKSGPLARSQAWVAGVPGRGDTFVSSDFGLAEVCATLARVECDADDAILLRVEPSALRPNLTRHDLDRSAATAPSEPSARMSSAGHLQLGGPGSASAPAPARCPSPSSTHTATQIKETE
jgi:hypothetical protein